MALSNDLIDRSIDIVISVALSEWESERLYVRVQQ